VERAELQRRLEAFAGAHYGAGAAVRALRGFSGSHGGLTFGFEVWDAGSETRVEELVIRLAPVGVRRSGNTDVARQVPLLRTLKTHGFPVPAIRFAGEDDNWFPTAYVIFERLPGRAFIVWDPDPSFDRSAGAVAPLWRQAVRALARVHCFDWETHLQGWEAPTPIEGEVARWDPILTKAAEPDWRRRGEVVRELFSRTPPPASPVGLLYGDCQPGNILYDAAGRLVGLLDWELSGIGAQLYDLGWLVMIGDRASWHPDWCPVNPLSPEELAGEYEAAAGRSCAGLAWYRALAGYRMAVVTGLFTRLHREGRRPDPAWEQFGLAVPALYERARELLLSGS
jgi:aminoglycoside phosphotransferase (APT) family kinase protein